MPRTVLTTGATGTVGSQLVHTLAKAGVRARALVRDDAKARSMLGDAADIVVGDLADEDAMRGALDRVDTLFSRLRERPQPDPAGVRRNRRCAVRGSGPRGEVVGPRR